MSKKKPGGWGDAPSNGMSGSLREDITAGKPQAKYQSPTPLFLHHLCKPFPLSSFLFPVSLLELSPPFIALGGLGLKARA